MPADLKDAAQENLKKLPLKLGLYRHYKANHYIVYGVSVMEDSLEYLVHYYSLEKDIRWTRTMQNFLEPVDVALGPARRFEFVREVEPIELAQAAGFQDLVDGLLHLRRAHDFIERTRL